MSKTKDSRTYAQKNREKRQKLVRDEIATKCKITHVLELAKKIENATDDIDIKKYKAAADIKLKLISKYVPDLKAVELSQDPENPLFEMQEHDRLREIEELINGGAGEALGITEGSGTTH